MQALHDHFGGDEDEEEGPLGDAGDKQISHSRF